MTLEELKDSILNNKFIKLPLIFYNESDDNFLIKSYIDSIAKQKNKEICEVADLREIDDINDSMFSYADYLYVLYSDVIPDTLRNNLIVVTNKKPQKNKGQITFPKLENWQIEEYVKTLIPGLTDKDAEWLCKLTGYNVYRLKNEAEKLNIFDEKEQSKMFGETMDCGGYADLSDLTIFNLSSSITKRDVVQIKKVLRDIDNIDIEAVGLITILLKNFYSIINIQMNKNSTPKSLNMTDKQFNAIRYNINKFTNQQLVKIYYFLNDFDYKLKSGLLDLDNKEKVYYIVSKILEV